jgi:putative transposase
VSDFLRRFLLAEAKRHSARVIELGIVPDHVHVLLELPPAFDVPRLVQGLKGASARIANRDGVAGHESLQWAQGYDLRSIGLRQLSTAVAYVREQARRHPQKARSQPARPLRTPEVAEPALQGTERTAARVGDPVG